MTLKAPTVLYTFHNNIMSKSLYISMLRQGSTGNEILSILDSLTETPEANIETTEPTLEPIQF